jgi:hypothetical protein
MGWRALRRASLVELVRTAKLLLQQAERQSPRKGPGRPPTIPDWALGALIMVAVLKRRKSKSAQYRFLQQNRADLQKWLGIDRFPARSTYFDRYRRAHRLFEVAVRLQGRQAIREHLVDAEVVVADKSLIVARGPTWHRSQRIKGIVLRGVDRDSTWSYSEHHGWVQGYGYEVVVSAAKSGVVFPLLASAQPASVHEAKSFLRQIPHLPRETKVVMADSGYDANDIAETIEWTSKGERTGRRFLCRQVKRWRQPAKRCWRETHRRRMRRVRREARAKYFHTRRARLLYRRRAKSVEPFHQWFKNLFQLDQVWHRGLENNRTQLLAAMFCYQLLLRHNHRHRLHHARIQWALDGL